MIIYKPLATLSTPPISREKEKKVSRTASRVSLYRIGRAGWTMYKFEAPFRRHETRREEEGGRKEEGENIDFESIDKRGRSTPSRPVSTPNWTEAGNKYYVSFVGREGADFIIAAQAEADVQSVWHTLRPSTDLYSVSLYVRLSCNRVGNGKSASICAAEATRATCTYSKFARNFPSEPSLFAISVKVGINI